MSPPPTSAAGIERATLSIQSGIQRLRGLFRLREDTDHAGTEEAIRANVDFRSANAWTLAFAILIASIGLNTNSAAVIIGAMLISPLMGPIVGAGFGLGISDLALVRRALANLGFAIIISLFVSFLYFWLSPLSEAQSELLARTRPTVFDAMIAMLGGAAGIVALSRSEKSNAIPGVAIATALMPPLCTAGYGLSQGNLSYFFGALYLFVINSVYICLSTLLFVRYLGFRHSPAQDDSQRSRMRRWIAATAILVLLPSLASAWLLLRETSFRSHANDFVRKELQSRSASVVGTEITYHWREPKLVVTLLGEPMSEEGIASLRQLMPRYELPEEALIIRQSDFSEKLEKRIRSGIFGQEQSRKEEELRTAMLQLKLNDYRQFHTLAQDAHSELAALFPKLLGVVAIPQDGGTIESARPTLTELLVQWSHPPSRTDMDKVTGFLRQRTKSEALAVSHWSPLGKLAAPKR